MKTNKVAAILAAHDKGLPNTQIAEEAACTRAYVSYVISAKGRTAHRAPSRAKSTRSKAPLSAAIAAERRKITIRELNSKVWRAVCEDDLFSAILDDGK